MTVGMSEKSARVFELSKKLLRQLDGASYIEAEAAMSWALGSMVAVACKDEKAGEELIEIITEYAVAAMKINLECGNKGSLGIVTNQTKTN